MHSDSTNPTPNLHGHSPNILSGMEARGGTCGAKRVGFAAHPENIYKNPRKRFTMLCENCGEKFELQEWEKGRARFCSMICFRDGELRKGWRLRFPKFVNQTEGCWEWMGNKLPSGYGRMTVNRKSVSAHRLAWELKTGSPPPENMLVCHHCDNPSCVNPDHLFLGTHQDNTDDMHQKGRANPLRGEKHQNAKLTESQATEIKKRALAGETHSLLSAEFGVSQPIISRIKTGKIWRHVVLS